MNGFIEFFLMVSVSLAEIRSPLGISVHSQRLAILLSETSFREPRFDIIAGGERELRRRTGSALLCDLRS